MHTNKAKSISLLFVYLFVFLQQVAALDNSYLFANYFSHEHDDYTDIHHEHHFHIGIFHFLGHLIENINQVEDYSNDHIAVNHSASTKKIANAKYPIVKSYFTRSLKVIEVGAESLPDPPYYQPHYLQKLYLYTSPLRAPPVIV